MPQDSSVSSFFTTRYLMSHWDSLKDIVGSKKPVYARSGFAKSLLHPDQVSSVDSHQNLDAGEILKERMHASLDRTSKSLHTSLQKVLLSSKIRPCLDAEIANYFRKPTVPLLGIMQNDVISPPPSIMEAGASLANQEVTSMSLSSSEQYFERQLKGVSPLITMKPIRGIVFPMLPVIHTNTGQKSYLMQGMTSEATFQLTTPAQKTGFKPLQMVAYQSEVNIFTQSITVNYNMFDILSYMFGEKLRGGDNAFVAAFQGLAMKQVSLMQQYYLALDNISTLGRLTPSGDDSSDEQVSNALCPLAEGQQEKTQTGVAEVNPIYAKKKFTDLNRGEITNLLHQVVVSIGKETKIAFKADTLLMDSDSYLHMFTVVVDGAGSSGGGNALSDFLASSTVEAIIPVAAWSQQYPGKTTLMACIRDPKYFHINTPRPLTLTGYDMQNSDLILTYSFSTTGPVFLQGDAVAQYQMDYS